MQIWNSNTSLPKSLYKKIEPHSGTRYCDIASSMNVMSEWDRWCWFRDRDNGGAIIGYFPLRQVPILLFQEFLMFIAWLLIILWERLWKCTNIKIKICTDKWLTKPPEINDARKRKVEGLVMTSLCLFLQDWYVLMPMRDYLSDFWIMAKLMAKILRNCKCFLLSKMLFILNSKIC